jgi:DASS family divalent anion:Na+ symporter
MHAQTAAASAAYHSALSEQADSVQTLLADSIFRQASYLSLARLLPYTSERRLQKGDTLYHAGMPAEEFFYLLDGEVELISSEQQSIIPGSRRLGEEAATDFDHYLADAIAVTDLRVLVISRKSLAILFEPRPDLKARFYFSLMQTFAGDNMHAAKTLDDAKADIAKKKPEQISIIIGWLLAVLAPALILYFGRGWGLEKPALYFMAICSTTIVMWVFTLVDEYIPGIFALLATLSMGLVPTPVILSGLASDGFVLAMSVLGLAAVIVSSGLSYRLLLQLLMRLPNTGFWQNSALLGIGFLITPLIPSINGRVALVTPFLSDMQEILRQKGKSPVANQLAVSAFVGVSLLSGVFLSSKSVNFVVFGLLPDQIQDQFQWLGWLASAAVAAGVLILLHAVMALLFLRGGERSHLSREQLAVQLSLLGNLKAGEWAAVAGVALFMLGVATSSIHKVASPWLGMAILFGILLFGALNKNEFREKIDWPFLIYLGGIVGITSAINYLGLGRVIAAQLPWLGEYMYTNFSLFVLLLAVVIFVIRLAVPISATIVIMATILMPVATHYGVNPWVVGFIVLLLGEMWFFPYQCSYYLQFKQLSRGRIYDERMFLSFNALANVVKIGAIYASMPYWKSMGLL